VLKLKLNNLNGEISKHTAKFVSKDFMHKVGLDYSKVYTLVTRLETMRLNVGVACGINWPLYHLDLNFTFINGPLEEVVYVTRPRGFEIKGKEGMVFTLC
jgi:hypothetical protein